MTIWFHPLDASTAKFLPKMYAEGRKLSVEKISKSCPRLLLDLEKTPLGGRLRFLRKRRGLTQAALERRTGISRITICKLERGGPAMRPEIVGKLLAYFGHEAGDAFPEGDPVDQVVPVSDFGSWLRNFRVRKGLQQVELAKRIGVCKASVCAYERNKTVPGSEVQRKLEKAFGLDGELKEALARSIQVRNF